MAVRECYIAMIEMEDRQKTMCIREQRAIAEPVEELEEVNLDDARPERTTRIGTLASWLVCQALTTFLKANQDMFAWSHKNRPLNHGSQAKCVVLNPSSPTGETRVCSGVGQGHSRGGSKVAKGRLHLRSILPGLAGQRRHG